MDAIQLLKNRRSVRKYKDQIVPRELIEEIVKLSQFAPSWSNYQVARYNIIDNRSLIEEIANNCVQCKNINQSQWRGCVKLCNR